MDAPKAYDREVPPHGNYAFDVMVEVGLSRLRDHRQDEEIQKDLKLRFGLDLPASSVGHLANSFLDGLAAIHQAAAPLLRQRLQQDGGYALHVDGTCEAGTDVLFTAVAEPRGWTLETAQMSSETVAETAKVLRRCVERFSPPLAVMRDLSKNIGKARREVIPEARDLICHYHFLENVGERLCEKPHAELTKAVRRLKVCSALRSLRKDLVRYSRQGEHFTIDDVDAILKRAASVDLDSIAMRRLLTYVLLRWMDDYQSDLKGEYFPFDLPQLAFYRRGVRLGALLSELVARPDFPARKLSTLKTAAGHLALLREDEQAVAAAARLEKASSLFEELRDVLRLSSRPGRRLLRSRGPTERREVAEKMEQRLERWREQLRKRWEQESDAHRRADARTVLDYLEEYAQQLVGHVIARPGCEPLVVCRTNNPAEHRFRFQKQGERRKQGVKTLTRAIESMRPEAFLVDNLKHPDYLDLVLSGELSNLAGALATHWELAQSIRKSRSEPRTDHPMPTTKRQLRDPALLDSVIETITTTIFDRPES